MSVVTGIMVICSVCEDDGEDENHPVLFEKLNDWIESRHKSRPLKLVEDHFGGNKHPQCYSAGAGMNHFDADAFAEFFLSLAWESPENAMLIMQPESGATRVFRPKGY